MLFSLCPFCFNGFCSDFVLRCSKMLSIPIWCDLVNGWCPHSSVGLKVTQEAIDFSTIHMNSFFRVSVVPNYAAASVSMVSARTLLRVARKCFRFQFGVPPWMAQFFCFSMSTSASSSACSSCEGKVTPSCSVFVLYCLWPVPKCLPQFPPDIPNHADS